MAEYETIIGLEIHVQTATDRKMFCNCLNRYGEKPNALMCPVCLGLPGALPVVNREAVEKAIRAALALNCRIESPTRFDRKNYFYPDLPKNYQISQYNHPFSRDGFIEIDAGGKRKKIRISNAHMEEDTGKSLHGDDGHSLIDLNRAGVPLLEVVSAPDMSSPEEAYEFCGKLKAVLQYAGVSDCDMEKGQLRVDVNLNVADRKTGERTAISEIKNLNSFRYMVDALKHEVARHVEALKKGDKLTHETRLYDSARGETRPMRSKEEIMDYRYFPEPDLNPLEISQDWIDEVHRALPELPDERRARYVRELGLPEYDAGVLVAEKEVAEFFEQCAAKSKDPKQASNWVMGEVLRAMKDSRRAISEIPVSPTALAELLALINDGTITNNIAKEVFAEMAKTGKPPAEIVKAKGMAQISDSGELEEAVKKVISENEKAVADYRAGKKQAAGFLMGQVMRATKGKANPDVVQQLIKKILG